MIGCIIKPELPTRPSLSSLFCFILQPYMFDPPFRVSMGFQFLHFLLLVGFSVPLILAVNSNDGTITSSQSHTDGCSIAPKNRGSNCDAGACYKDNGRCRMSSFNRCNSYLFLPTRNMLISHRLSDGPSSCKECGCKKTSRLKMMPSPVNDEARGFRECGIQSAGDCRATKCLTAGGRCIIRERSQSCYSAVLDPTGALVVQQWKKPPAPPECRGCRCRKIAVDR